MDTDTYVKEVVDGKGQRKYRAEVWLKGVFYTSKTFVSKQLATKFKANKLEEAIAGDLQPAATRRKQRDANQTLTRSLEQWVEEYLKGPGAEHTKGRQREYRQVARLLPGKTLAHFQGRDGGNLFSSLADVWGASPSRCSAKNISAPPLAPNTVRLRLSALQRIIRFAESKLPAGAQHVPMSMAEVFDFKMPSAHGNPRQRLPADSEYGSLVDHFGEASAFGVLLQLVDETGCRLGEILNSQAHDYVLFEAGDKVTGGVLTLERHKTWHKTGKPRYVPLSLFAAQLIQDRRQAIPEGRLFTSLGDNTAVCKTFDAACTSLSIEDLWLKDFRRAFINRNKNSVSTLDLKHIVGASSLLGKLSAAEAGVQEAVGHASAATTASYSVPDMRRLSEAFTLTSRKWHTGRPVGDEGHSGAERSFAVAEAQAELAAVLAKLRLLGASTHG